MASLRFRQEVRLFVSENARHGTGLGIKRVPAPKPKSAEDIPGVPTAAWARVKRGVPASDPFKPGVGFMLMVDGARFLPGTAYAIPDIPMFVGTAF